MKDAYYFLQQQGAWLHIFLFGCVSSESQFTEPETPPSGQGQNQRTKQYALKNAMSL
jgi:hypothetical protein